MLILGFIYSLMVNANINGVGNNFIRTEDLQKPEGDRTIKRAHMLGFLDPDLPKRGERQSAPPREPFASPAR
jgi:hypothetical protein